jgi:hypothetical protein
MSQVDTVSTERHSLAPCVLCVQVYGLLDRSWDQFIAFSQAYEAAGCKITAPAAVACKAALLPGVKPHASPEPLDQMVADLQEQLLQLQKEKAAADAENVSLQGQLRQFKLQQRLHEMKLRQLPAAPLQPAAAAAEVAEVTAAMGTPTKNRNDKKTTARQQLQAQKKSKKELYGTGKKQHRNLRRFCGDEYEEYQQDIMSDH